MDNYLLCSLNQIGISLDFSNECIYHILSKPKICHLIGKLACYCTIHDLYNDIVHSSFKKIYLPFDSTFLLILTIESIIEDIFNKFLEILNLLLCILNFHSNVSGESSIFGIICSFSLYLSSRLSVLYHVSSNLSSFLEACQSCNVVDNLVHLSNNQQTLFSLQFSKVVYFLI